MAKQRRLNSRSSSLHTDQTETRLCLQNKATQMINSAFAVALRAHAHAQQAVCVTRLVTLQTAPSLDTFYITHRT